MDFKSNKRL